MARPTKEEKQKQADEAKKKYSNWYDVVFKKATPIPLTIRPLKKTIR